MGRCGIGIPTIGSNTGDIIMALEDETWTHIFGTSFPNSTLKSTKQNRETLA